MKQILTLILTLPALAATAQSLTNDGATITVQPGATIYVDGGVQNKAGSTLTNAGTVQLNGDLTNAGTLASSGLLLFTGSTNQTFTPGTAATVAAVTLNNTGAVGARTLNVPADLTITSALTLTSGLVRTAPAATITLLNGASVVGETDGRYVQGNLRVVRNTVTGSTAVDFTNGATLNPNGLNLGNVTITRTAGLQTAGTSFGQNMAGTNKGIDRVWSIAATGTQPSTATPATVALSWISDDDNGFAAGTNAQLWRAASAAGPWSKLGTPASAASRTFTSNAVSILGTLTVSNITAPLPVELLTFTAELRETNGILNWTTATEKNNAYFQVESSADGRSFQRLGQVAGHGTSAQRQDYSFTDKNLPRYAVDQVYYRLRQVDVDGTETISPIRVLQVPAAAGLLVQAYPNPFQQQVALTIRTGQAGAATIQLTDAVGRQLGQRKLDLPLGSSTLTLDEASGLPQGVYLLRVRQGEQQQTLKLVRE